MISRSRSSSAHAGLTQSLAAYLGRHLAVLRHELPLAAAVFLATAKASGALIWTQDSDLEDLDGVNYVARR